MWAPFAKKVEVHFSFPQDRIVPLQDAPRGYHHGVVEGVGTDTLYQYRLDGERERPDPASRFQPHGVHGPSQIVEPRFPWDDGHWFGIPLQGYIIYELHAGLFTLDGTFEAIIAHLDELRDLGITALELMPVAQFPGTAIGGTTVPIPLPYRTPMEDRQTLKGW